MQAGLVYYFISSGWTHPAGQSVTTVLAACQFALFTRLREEFPADQKLLGRSGVFLLLFARFSLALFDTFMASAPLAISFAFGLMTCLHKRWLGNVTQHQGLLAPLRHVSSFRFTSSPLMR